MSVPWLPAIYWQVILPWAVSSQKTSPLEWDKPLQDAVETWMGDDPHLNTMLSGNLQDVGAGVGVYGNTYYYVLDAVSPPAGNRLPILPSCT